MVATFLCALSFILLLHMSNCEHCYKAALPLVILGIGFSIFAAGFWSTIAEEFTADIAGTAYGLCFCCQNLGLCTFPIIGNGLRTWSYDEEMFGYRSVIFISLTHIAIAFLHWCFSVSFLLVYMVEVH